MTDLTPVASLDSVLQLETTTRALAGTGNPMNVQAQALLNRTKFLDDARLAQAAQVASLADFDADLQDDIDPALGSGLIGLTRLNGLTGRTVQDFARESVSINDFFIPGQIDWTAALQAAHDYLFGFPGKPPALEFVGGEVYEAATMPNWGDIQWLILRGNNSTLRNTGAGDNLILDAGAGAELTFAGHVSGFFLEGGPASGHGVFARSYHHAYVQAEVRGCGTVKNALQVNFAVVSKFEVTASINRGPWYLGGQPQRGIVLDVRAALEAVTACTFINPVIEGVSAQGILLTNADTCTFIGGTSEANASANVEVAFESRFNNFYGIDLEVSGSGQGFIDRGRQNSWHNIYNDALCTITSTAVGCRIVGGAVDAISNSSASTDLDGVRYGLAAGVITNVGGVTPRMRNVYSIVAAAFIPDQLIEVKIGAGGATIKKHISLSVATGAWSVPVGVPGISKKDSIAFPGVVLGDTILIGCQSVIPEGYTLSAVVTAADVVSLRMYQLYGAAASPFPAGATFRLDAWGH
ncbi:MAG: hypothetical protein K5804_17930 [Microbacterium sp.]|uniref:hypothetical protein n=1 Tax=Microbacterium sp. TaxID=51671 RepID=UPI0026062D26|nr:hypothetical protein [Microbacterium sp.]MCV0420125.1 hypothetical protein [Microbacterium sp.]